jgi:hypothetical protein
LDETAVRASGEEKRVDDIYVSIKQRTRLEDSESKLISYQSPLREAPDFQFETTGSTSTAIIRHRCALAASFP